jgi:hypothetical protein
VRPWCVAQVHRRRDSSVDTLYKHTHAPELLLVVDGLIVEFVHVMAMMMGLS